MQVSSKLAGGAMRDEQADGTFVAQKIQSVLIHGVALIFYPITPNVPLGMDLTVSCLIDALQYLDPRVRKVRFQYDGNYPTPPIKQ